MAPPLAAPVTAASITTLPEAVDAIFNASDATRFPPIERAMEIVKSGSPSITNQEALNILRAASAKKAQEILTHTQFHVEIDSSGGLSITPAQDSNALRYALKQSGSKFTTDEAGTLRISRLGDENAVVILRDLISSNNLLLSETAQQHLIELSGARPKGNDPATPRVAAMEEAIKQFSDPAVYEHTRALDIIRHANFTPDVIIEGNKKIIGLRPQNPSPELAHALELLDIRSEKDPASGKLYVASSKKYDSDRMEIPDYAVRVEDITGSLDYSALMHKLIDPMNIERLPVSETQTKLVIEFPRESGRRTTSGAITDLLFKQDIQFYLEYNDETGKGTLTIPDAEAFFTTFKPQKAEPASHIATPPVAPKPSAPGEEQTPLTPNDPEAERIKRIALTRKRLNDKETTKPRESPVPRYEEIRLVFADDILRAGTATEHGTLRISAEHNNHELAGRLIPLGIEVPGAGNGNDLLIPADAVEKLQLIRSQDGRIPTGHHDSSLPPDGTTRLFADNETHAREMGRIAEEKGATARVVIMEGLQPWVDILDPSGKLGDNLHNLAKQARETPNPTSPPVSEPAPTKRTAETVPKSTAPAREYPKIEIGGVTNKAIAWTGLLRGTTGMATGNSTAPETAMTTMNAGVVVTQELAEMYNGRATALIELAQKETQEAERLAKLAQAAKAARSGGKLAEFSNTGGKLLGGVGVGMDVMGAVEADNAVSRAGHITNAGLGTTMLLVETGPAGWVIGGTMMAVSGVVEVNEAYRDGIRAVEQTNQQINGANVTPAYLGHALGSPPDALRPRLSEYKQLNRVMELLNKDWQQITDPKVIRTLLLEELKKAKRATAKTAPGVSEEPFQILGTAKDPVVMQYESALQELGNPEDPKGTCGNGIPTYSSRVLQANQLRQKFPEKAARLEAQLERSGLYAERKMEGEWTPEQQKAALVQDLKDTERELQELQAMTHEQRDTYLRANEAFLKEAGISRFSPLASAFLTYDNLNEKAAAIGIADLKPYGLEQEVAASFKHKSEHLHEMMARLQREGKIKEDNTDFFHPTVSLTEKATPADHTEFTVTLAQLGINTLAPKGISSFLDSELMAMGDATKYKHTPEDAYRWVKGHIETDPAMALAEKQYLEAHPAAAQSVNAGLVGSGLEYFARMGIYQGENYGGANAQTLSHISLTTDQSETTLRSNFARLARTTVQQVDANAKKREEQLFSSEREHFIAEVKELKQKGVLKPGKIPPLIEAYRDSLPDVVTQPTLPENVATKAAYYHVDLSAPDIGLLPPSTDKAKPKDQLRATIEQLDRGNLIGVKKYSATEEAPPKPYIAVIIEGPAKTQLIEQLRALRIQNSEVIALDEMSFGGSHSAKGGILIEWNKETSQLLQGAAPAHLVNKLNMEAAMSQAPHINLDWVPHQGSGEAIHPPHNPRTQPSTARTGKH